MADSREYRKALPKHLLERDIISKMLSFNKKLDPSLNFTYQGKNFEFKTNWETNPIGWVNELWQNVELRKKLGLDNSYVCAIRSTFELSYTYKATFCVLQNNSLLEFTEKGPVRKQVERDVYYKFCSHVNGDNDLYLVADGQMDSTESTVSGMVTLESDQKINTQIDRAAPLSSNIEMQTTRLNMDKEKFVMKLASAQEICQFPSLTNRWFEIDHGIFSTSDTNGQPQKSWDLPKAFYSNTSAANLLPFKQFVMCAPNITVKMKINSHKFAQGKYVLSFMYDSNEIQTQWLNSGTCVQRSHALIDLNESNEVELSIPYRAITPFIITQAGREGFETGQYVTVHLNCITPLKVPDESPTTVPWTIFIRFDQVNFTGMRYFAEPAEPQMGNLQTRMDTSKDIISGIENLPIVGSLAKPIVKTMGYSALALQRPFRSEETMKEVERRFRYVGLINNRDKPIEFKQPMNVRPQIVGSLGDGIGIEEVITFRLDPTATTIHDENLLTVDTYSSIKEIIQIPGIDSIFTWKIADTASTLLWSQEVWPFRKQTNINQGVMITSPTPLEYFSYCFLYYAGSIEYDFDFVCTQFHTGSIMISYIPYNASYTFDQAKSGYYEIFDLREQKRVKFRVPYIRTTISQMMPQSGPMDSAGIDPPSPGSICVWVLNPLTPIQSVSTTMDVIVWKKAGPDFMFSYPYNRIYTINSSDQFSYGQRPTTAEAQMDRIHQDEIDQTETFNQTAGIGPLLQVNEDHMNIKDLMRRWVVLTDITLEKKQLGIPIVPWCHRHSASFALRDCFRWMRGSVDIMLVSKSTTRDLINVFHVPQSVYCPTFGENTNLDPALVYGLARTLWDTSINPTLKLEIPFSGLFNYIDNFSTNGKAPSEIYHKFAHNLGYIVLESEIASKFDITIYWRYADDAKFYNFVGCPSFDTYPQVKPTTSRVNFSTNLQDFQNQTNSLALSNGTSITNFDLLKLAGDVELNPGPEFPDYDEYFNNIMDMPNPLVFPETDVNPTTFSTRIYDSVKTVSSSVLSPITNTISAMRNSDLAVTSLAKASQAWEKSGDKLNSVLDHLSEIANNIVTQVKKSCKWVTNLGSLFSAVLHFLQVYLNPSWQSFCIAFTGTLTAIGDFFAPVASKLLNFFTSLPFHASGEHRAEATAQMPEITQDDQVGLCALLFATVSGYLGYKGTPPNMTKWTKILHFNNNFWRTMTGAISFLKNIISVVKRMFYWIATKIPIVNSYFTLYSKNENICKFVENAQYCLDEKNLNLLINNPEFKSKFWCTTVEAYQLQKRLIINPEPNTAALLRLISKVIDKSNELAVNLTASPVRYEPYVLKVSGRTKIGKSYMISEQMPLLLKESFDVEEMGSVFTRTPGVEFWNGYRNQKGILYDDFLAVRDQQIAISQVVELYNLKSTAIMNMNMASLNDKQIKGNPYLVTLLCNNGFTTINGTVEPKAFLRRADSHWRCMLDRKYRKIEEVPENVKSNYEHLVFQRYNDVGNERSIDPQILSYQQWRKAIVKDMRKYHDIEKKNMKKRMDALVATLPKEAAARMGDVDPYSIFYEIHNKVADSCPVQTGMTPTETIDTLVRQIQGVTDAITQVRSDILQGRAKTIQRATRQDPETNLEEYNLFDVEEGDEAQVIDMSTEQYPMVLNAELQEPAQPQFPFQNQLQWLYSKWRKLIFLEGGFPNLPVLIGECPMCYGDGIPLTVACENHHRWCLECMERMLEANPDCVCPICRTSTMAELENHWFDSNLRAVLWTQRTWNYFSKKVKYAYNHPKEVLDNFRRWLYHSRTGKLILLSIMTSLYVSMTTHLIAMDQRERHDKLHPLWEFFGISHFKPIQANKLGGLIGWNDWKVDICATDWDGSGGPRSETFSRDEGLGIIATYNLPNNCGVPESRPVPGYLDNWLGGIPSSNMGMNNKPAALGQMEEPLVSVTGAPFTPAIPNRELMNPIRNLAIADAQAVGWEFCPHYALREALDKKGLVNIDYCMDVEHGGDVYGWYIDFEAEGGVEGWIPDAPCQHDNCYISDPVARQFFLKEWATARHAMIRQRRLDWRQGSPWPLPREFRSATSERIQNVRMKKMLDQVRKFREVHWIDKVQACFKEVWKWTKIMFSLVTVITTISRTINFAKWMCGFGTSKQTEAVPQLIASGSHVTSRLPKSNRLPASATKAATQMNESQVNAAMNLVQRNTFFIQATWNGLEGNQNGLTMRGLGLYGRIGIIPAHYGKFLISKVTEERENRIKNLNICVYLFKAKDVVIDFPEIDKRLAFSDSEHCYISFLPNFAQFKDLTHLIPKVEEHNNIGSKYIHFEPSSTTNGIIAVQGTIQGVLNQLDLNPGPGYSGYTIFDVYKTSYGTKGACGAAYLTDYTKPIFGLHVAGSPDGSLNLGYGIPLIWEDIEKLKTGTEVLSCFVPATKGCAQAELPGAVLPICNLSKLEACHLPTKSKIQPSLIAKQIEEEWGPAKTQPAILSSKDPRWIWDKSPLYWGCVKHTQPPKTFNQDILDDTFQEFKLKFIPKLLPIKSVEPITIEQAITGFDNVPYFDTLDMSTSSGWPWNVGSKKRKDEWIKIERDSNNKIIKCEVDPKLIENLNFKDSLRMRRITPYTVFLDWLKDERRKESKINDSAGTRIFSLSPLDFTIHLRQATLDFCASFMHNRFEVESIVGISPDGHEWSRLANELIDFSPHIITFDYSDFGPRLPADVGRKVMQFIRDWYAEYAPNNGFDYQTRLTVMENELFNALHLCNRFVYQTFCGAPSGAATTVIHNTLVNIMELRYIWRWLIIKMKLDFTLLGKFEDYVKLFCYGDDGIMSVKEEVLSWFNLKNIMIAFQAHDIVITDAEKKTSRKRGEPIPDVDLPLSMKLEDSSVLKRGFKRHPQRKGQWLAPIDEVSIKETPRWIWKSSDDAAATQLNAEQAVLLSYGHGPEYFNNVKKIVNKCLQKNSLKPIATLWNDLDKTFFGDFIAGELCPNSRLNEMFGLSGASKPQKVTKPSEDSSTRQIVQPGLKTEVLVVEDKDLVKFDQSGGRFSTTLYWKPDEVELPPLVHYPVSGGGTGVNP